MTHQQAKKTDSPYREDRRCHPEWDKIKKDTDITKTEKTI
jgi:hypothetical protein